MMRPALLVELLLLTLLAALGASALAWQVGQWGWNWDAINHHIYLGLAAEQARWSLDVLAAGTQVYQYPYLYWPVYKIAQMSGSGLAAAIAWSAAQAATDHPDHERHSARAPARRRAARQHKHRRRGRPTPRPPA